MMNCLTEEKNNMKHGGHNYHPSRISNQAKMEHKRAYDKLVEKKKKLPLKLIDVSKSDWFKK